MIIILDLSAVFETVSHKILLQCLEQRSGMDGVVIKWASLPKQQMSVCTHEWHYGKQGVPQGLIFGLLLLKMYSSPWAQIINLKYHVNINDVQISLSLCPTDPVAADIILCIQE